MHLVLRARELLPAFLFDQCPDQPPERDDGQGDAAEDRQHLEDAVERASVLRGAGWSSSTPSSQPTASCVRYTCSVAS